jgi:hypothetical protein
LSRSLNWVTTSHLECPFKESDPDVRDLIYTAINYVLEVWVSAFILVLKYIPVRRKGEINTYGTVCRYSQFCGSAGMRIILPDPDQKLFESMRIRFWIRPVTVSYFLLFN